MNAIFLRIFSKFTGVFLLGFALNASATTYLIDSTYLYDSAVTQPTPVIQVASNTWSYDSYAGAKTAAIAAYSTAIKYGFTATYSESTTGSLTTFTVSAVPEPETYAMMAIGLGMMGWIARRRRGDSQAAASGLVPA